MTSLVLITLLSAAPAQQCALPPAPIPPLIVTVSL